MPPNWGGYLIAPEVVEFWQGRENRVHNRIRVARAASSGSSLSCGGSSPTPHRFEHPTSGGCGWLGIVTVIGGNLTIFAVPVQLYALTQNSAYVGLVRLVRARAAHRVRAVGGAWADAMDRRLLLIIASCGLAVASVLLWLQAALALNNVWVVLCLLSVQQAFYAINQPTRSAAIPRMLPGEQLPAANSLNMTVMQFGAIVGPLLAGVMLHWVDLSTLYLIDAITCVAPIWATFRLAPMPTSNGGNGSSGAGSPRCWTDSATWPETRWC